MTLQSWLENEMNNEVKELEKEMAKLRLDYQQYLRKQEHPSECKWHKDWHACDCGAFDDEEAVKDARSYKHLRQHCVAYQEGGIGCPDCYCDENRKEDNCE